MSANASASTVPASTTTSAIAALDHLAALRMLGWLSAVLEFGPIAPEDWANAYAAAADDQTVRTIRAELAQAGA